MQKFDTMLLLIARVSQRRKLFDAKILQTELSRSTVCGKPGVPYDLSYESEQSLSTLQKHAV